MAAGGGTRTRVASRASSESTVRLPGSTWDSPLDRPLPRGRHGFPLEQVAIARRARMLDAFVAEVSRSGFAGTHVSKVCATAGASTKAFYATFGNKVGCLLQAFDAGAAVVCDRALAAFRRSEGPWPSRTAVALETVLGILAGNPPFARLALAEVPRLGSAGTERLEAAAARLLGPMGIERDGPRSPGASVPGVGLGSLVAATVHLLAEWVEAGKAEQLVELAPTLGHWLSAWTAGLGGVPLWARP